MYDRTTVHGATFNMRGQLYRGHANATALFSSPVVSALGSESDDPVYPNVFFYSAVRAFCSHVDYNEV